MVLAGALPFGAVFIELFFILESLFENEFYYMFGTDLLLDSDVSSVPFVRAALSKFKTGFLFLVFVIVIIAVAQISIVLVYYQLCNEGKSPSACPDRPSVNRALIYILDHCWMWKSFISGGGISLYVFGYLIYYHIVKLDITSFTPIVLYFR